MPKSIRKISKDKRVSMKEAFDNVTDKVTKKRTVRNGKRKKNPVRDFFWNYPDFLVRIWNLTTPLSTIFLFLLLGLGLFSFLRSDTFAEKVSTRELNYYVEGRVGAISTFNPLFSNQNDIDKAIQELVFEKFVYIDSTGKILPGVATDWDISDDGKKYVFDIDLNHTWSDGTPLTMDDIFFTFDTAVTLNEDQGYDTVASSLADVDI